MSRSCQSGTFSKPTTALPRSTRARPLMRSQVIGLRLCGIAEEPFWPRANGSAASRTSLRWRWRISVAKRSSELPRIASAASSSAWRSRADDLRRDVLAPEAERGERELLDARVDVAVGADGARELADGDAGERALDALAAARQVVPPAEQLEPERRRLGVHAVRAAHAGRVAVLERALEHGVERAVEPASSSAPGGAQLQREARVDDVRRRQPVVEPARLLADLLGDRLGERDHVVVGALLDLLRARDERGVDVRALAHGGDGALAARRRARSRRRAPRSRPRASSGGAPRRSRWLQAVGASSGRSPRQHTSSERGTELPGHLGEREHVGVGRAVVRHARPQREDAADRRARREHAAVALHARRAARGCAHRARRDRPCRAGGGGRRRPRAAARRAARGRAPRAPRRRAAAPAARRSRPRPRSRPRRRR